MMTEDLPFAAEFPAATRDDWLKLVQSALKDRPFERLIAKTYDGIPIEPLYARAAAMPSIAVRGIDIHIGSQITELEPYREAGEKVLALVDRLAAEGIRLSHVDL